MSAKRPLLFRIIINAVLIIVLLAIIFYPKIKSNMDFGKSEQLVRQGGMYGGGEPLYASGYLIKPVDMNELIYSTGTLMPDEEVDLSFETSGKVVGIYFSEGTSVKKGELLAKINDRPLQAQLLKVEAQLKLTKEREFRQRQLLDRDAISRESYDQVATELQSLEADIKLLEARISETELRAPFDGVVGLRMISEGAIATTQTKIVSLVKDRPLKIEFSVPERYAGQIKPGFPITFEIDGYEDLFTAKVYAVDPMIDISTRTIVARALFPNKNSEMKSGRFASVQAVLSQIENTISVPTQAIIPEMSGEKVFVFRNGKAEEVKVDLGLRTASHVEVTHGLSFGDTLLTTAILQLRHGLPVQLDTLVTNQSNTSN
ncbi:MAG: efflux RND transporter periplasmic adaptor subunit [Prolixibacteraceae bacterium]|jgi:membrane fusion protein (multidrug efflux system)|nr:efflux RND transporter periplasmic adaptor subunit [Prolixibacteraceae bacterium]